MTYVRKTVRVRDVVLNQPHRARPVNPSTAHCAQWLSPEQSEIAHQRHLDAGRKLIGEVACPCGNHVRRTYR